MEHQETLKFQSQRVHILHRRLLKVLNVVPKTYEKMEQQSYLAIIISTKLKEALKNYAELKYLRLPSRFQPGGISSNRDN